MDQRSGIRQHLDDLPERWAEILRMRYGLADGIPATLSELADSLDMTPLRIRQLEKAALIMVHHLDEGYTQEEALAVVEATMVADDDPS